MALKSVSEVSEISILLLGMSILLELNILVVILIPDDTPIAAPFFLSPL